MNRADFTVADRLVRTTKALNQYFVEGVTPDYGTYTWGYQGRIGLGNNNPASPLGLTHIVPWGVIFRNRDNLPDGDVMVKVGDLRLYLLSATTGLWSLQQSYMRPDGQLYSVTFTTVGGGNDNVPPVGPAPVYSAAPNKMITQITTANQCYHFYGNKLAYDAPLGGAIVVFTANLVSKTGADLTGRSGCLLGQVGCDFKTADGNTIRDAFVSSTIPVTGNTRVFAATTMTMAQMLANPPDFAPFRQLTSINPIGIDPDYVPA